MLDRKYIKELKRRRMLERRVKCHGNKYHCLIAHPTKTESSIEYLTPPTFHSPNVQPSEIGWFRKLLRFLRIIK